MRITRNFKRWFGRLHIHSKIIFTFLPLSLIPLIALGLISSKMFGDTVVEKEKNNIRDESRLILSQLDSIIQNTESLTNIMTTDIHQLFNEYSARDTDVDEKRFQNLMESRLSIDLLMFPDVDSAVFLDTSGRIFSSYPQKGERDREVLNSPLPEMVQSQGSYGVNRWLPMERRNFMVTNPDIPVLTLGKMVFDLDTGKTLGTLFVNVKETTFASFLQVTPENFSSKEYYIVDSRGQIVSTPVSDRLLTPFSALSSPRLLEQEGNISEIVGRGKQEKLTTLTPYDKLDWKLVSIVSLEELNGIIYRNFFLTFTVGFLGLLLALLLTRKLAQIIVGPLLQVTKAMRRVKDGDLDATSTVATEDEVGLISSVFNSMVGQIRELLRTVTEDQARKRAYELALMHAQIKPHFLYNTLDTIYVLNDLGMNEEARDTTKALADFYRAVLSKGSEIIPLGAEVSNVRDYLNIMQVRNPDVLRYMIEIPEELEAVTVPKLSLQPLVENAIYHGLKTKGEQGLISIRAEKTGKSVTITVEDNGVGMSEEQLERVEAAISGMGRRKSIGLYSVHERIKLYFGEAYGLTVLSRPGEGTAIEMKVPGKEGDDNDVQSTYRR
ncbi:sensor histidine kinase [Paenibacillus sanfengchensis]|uniref:sensor histidine kinase n=1 Tax=Paenibacillus sanfengchensis TaxID=3119819 RepID=UPI002FDFB450